MIYSNLDPATIRIALQILRVPVPTSGVKSKQDNTHILRTVTDEVVLGATQEKGEKTNRAYLQL